MSFPIQNGKHIVDIHPIEYVYPLPSDFELYIFLLKNVYVCEKCIYNCSNVYIYMYIYTYIFMYVYVCVYTHTCCC